MGAPNRYFLCVQPLCDTVRIKDARYFPFIELVKVKVTKSTENLVIKDDGNTFVVAVNQAAGSRHYDRFSPDSASETVLAKYIESTYVFKGGSDNDYVWLGDIDARKAQRVAVDLSGALARVGIDEYEWLRRGGNAKR